LRTGKPGVGADIEQLIIDYAVVAPLDDCEMLLMSSSLVAPDVDLECRCDMMVFLGVKVVEIGVEQRRGMSSVVGKTLE
jgi:hypothetical protein